MEWVFEDVLPCNYRQPHFYCTLSCIMSYLVVCSPLPANIKEMKEAGSTKLPEQTVKVQEIDLLLWNVSTFKLNVKTDIQPDKRDSVYFRAETANTPFRSLKHTKHVQEDSFIPLCENISSYNQMPTKSVIKNITKKEKYAKVLLNIKLQCSQLYQRQINFLWSEDDILIGKQC